MQQIKFSLIIPIYNKETLVQNLFNLLEEINYSKIEVIFIDDGSTDNSLFLIKKLAKKSKLTIKILHQTNSGPGVARNKGLKISTGDYIWFIDSDDIFNIDAFNNFNKIINTHKNVDIICFNHLQTSEYNIHFDPIKDIQIEYISPKYALLYESVTPWSKIYKRSYLQKNKLIFPKFYFAEDLVFTRKSFCLTNNIIHSNCVFYKWITNDNSISHTHYGKHSQDFVFIIKDLFNFAQQNKEYKEEIYYNITNHSKNFINNIKIKKDYIKEIEEIQNYIITNNINNNTYSILEENITQYYTSSKRWKFTEPLSKLKKIIRRNHD